MAYTYDELKGKTIAELRDIAKDVSHDAVQGFSQMNKDHLLPALCKALNIDTHGHLVCTPVQREFFRDHSEMFDSRPPGKTFVA